MPERGGSWALNEQEARRANKSSAPDRYAEGIAEGRAQAFKEAAEIARECGKRARRYADIFAGAGNDMASFRHSKIAESMIGITQAIEAAAKGGQK